MFLLLTKASYRSNGVGMHIRLYRLPLLLVLSQYLSPYLTHAGRVFFFLGFLQLQLGGGISRHFTPTNGNSTGVIDSPAQHHPEYYQHNYFISYKPVGTFIYPLIVNLVRGSEGGGYIDSGSIGKRILGIFSKLFSL